jgi:hypothetical protein
MFQFPVNRQSSIVIRHSSFVNQKEGTMPKRPLGRRQFVHFLSALSAGGTLFGNTFLLLAQEEKKVTKEMLLQVEQLAGIRFTDEQRELMIPTLETYLQNFQKIREMSVPPEVAPAMYFIPDTRGIWKLSRG